MSDSKITLIGLGNTLRQDDSVGLVLVKEIRTQLSGRIDVRLWHGLDALSMAAELLEINNTVVMVDCADMGLPSGEFRWFESTQCHLKNDFSCVSTHGFGFEEALALAETIGFKQKLYFFAIQPFDLGFSSSLSQPLKQQLTTVSDALLHHLDELIHHNAIA